MTAEIESEVSLIMACRNEAQHLDDCLSSLWNLDYPKDKLEIIIVDGLSADSSLAVAEKWRKNWPGVRVVTNPHRFAPAAFNLGIIAARGEIICILSPRHRLSANYLREGIRALLSDEKIFCVGGFPRNRSDSATGRAIALALQSPFGVGSKNFRSLQKDAFVDTVGTPLYKKGILLKAGLFDEGLVRNQDDDLNFRLRQLGGKILLCSKIFAEYFVRDRLLQLFKQYEQYGYWKVFVGRKHSALTNLRQLVPPLTLVFFIPLMPFYFSASFLVSLRLSSEWREIPKIMAAFLCVHFGYGWGYLRGVFDFFILKKIEVNPEFAELTR